MPLIATKPAIKSSACPSTGIKSGITSIGLNMNSTIKNNTIIFTIFFKLIFHLLLSLYILNGIIDLDELFKRVKIFQPCKILIQNILVYIQVISRQLLF
ncbi:hypothetical protein M0Q39_04735 [Patescibacteria group bacterium]|jgi:hypothetical protein|nr:hypothetical protein [Patescibacteria group bacterium]